MMDDDGDDDDDDDDDDGGDDDDAFSLYNYQVNLMLETAKAVTSQSDPSHKPI